MSGDTFAAGKSALDCMGVDAFTMLLDKYTSLGVYVIHHSFTLAELFALSGLQLVSNTLTAGIRTAEESVRVVDGLFGSTETSKALAAVVGLVKKEVYEDQDFAITRAGKMAVLASITKAITVFACLQAATHKRTQKSVRTMLVYEGVVVSKPKRLGAESGDLVVARRFDPTADEDDDSGELLKDLSNALVTDPDDVTEDMTTTQIERVLSADILQVTTTTTLTTTTTQTFVRPGADLSQLGKPLPPIHSDRDSSSPSLQRQKHYPTSLETASSSRAASSSMAITTRSRRGSVSSIASVATTLTQYATTSIVSNPHGTANGSTRHSNLSSSDSFAPSESLVSEGNRQANNNLRLMFSTVTKKFKKNQKVQIGGETDGTVLSRTQEREIRTSEARDSLDWSEDDTDWIEVTKSSETMSSMEMNAALSYDVPMEKKSSDRFGPAAFGLKSGLSTKKFGRSFFSKMTKQSTFGKGNERKSLDGSGPQLTITEVDESRNDSDNSLSDKFRDAGPTFKGLKGHRDDEDSRPPPPPKEPKEPNPANFPRDHLVRNIQRFMRYASASYGHNFMRILGIGVIGDAVYSPYGDHPNHHAFATHTSTPLDSILLSSFTDPGTKGGFQAPKMHSLVHYINLDHGAQCVVLTCRGTLGLSDVLTDLCAHYDDLVLPTSHHPSGKNGASAAGSKYKVHAGMHASARLLSLETSTVFKTIKKALDDYPDYGLVLCGHSLGGGVAAILGVLWAMKSQDFIAYLEQEEGSSDEEEDEENEHSGKINGHRARRSRRRRHLYPDITTPFVTSPGSGLPSGRPIHCYAYGPPCVMSLPLSKYCEGLITTVVHQYDLVPTLSLGLLRDFKNVAVTLHEEGQVVEDIVRRLIIGASSNKVNAERQAAEDAKVASTTYTSSIANGSTSTSSSPPPPPPKKEQQDGGPPKRSQTMPMYSEYDSWQLQAAEDQDWSWSLIKTMRADMGSDKLYPPTPVYLVESIATTVVPPGSSTLTTTTAAVAASMDSRSATPSSVPLSKSFSASGAFSVAAGAAGAAASFANGFRPSSPFGRSATPNPSGAKTKVTPPSTMPQVPKTAYKVSMRRYDHVEDRFGELQFARSMFTDHNPANYEACVERLVEAVFPSEE
ncbi:hypothetical protein EC968_005661 [Mortierella alpina]|nr:hypothetical protein EC968_005661 [Mortierella alpina]